MEKTNFTFVRPAQWMKLAFMLVATLCFGLTPVTGQVPGEDLCVPPALQVDSCYQDGAYLTWFSPNGDEDEGISDHCWLIRVTGAGPVHLVGGGAIGVVVDYLGAQLLNSLVEVEICEGDDDLEISAVDPVAFPGVYAISYRLSSDLIQPGTAYWAAVAEVCNRMPALGNNSSWNFQRDILPVDYPVGGPFDLSEIFDDYMWDGYEGYFKTKDAPFDFEVTTEMPTCPDESPGPGDDGKIIVNIIDMETCTGRYNIFINGDKMPNPMGGFRFGGGMHMFSGYSAGTYQV